MGVGSNLKRRFASIGLHATGGGCGCDDLAKAMDAAGVAWCIARREYLLDEIGKNAAKRRVPFIRYAAGAILDAAIEEERQAEATKAQRAAMSLDSRLVEIIADIDAGPRQRESKWNWQPDTIEAMRRVVARQLALIDLDHPPTHTPGCGIVTLGGSLKYFPSVFVLCRMLRATGCNLPIQVWHLGEAEMDPRMAAMLADLGNVECVDAMQSIPSKPRMLGGWEAKAWAIQHSPFAEVLFLDADIVPACDPTYLFSESRYLDRGVVAWPNYEQAGSYVATEEGFRVVGLECPGFDDRKRWPNHTRPTNYQAWDTGQLLVDKSRHWGAIEIAKVLSGYADFFYPRGAPVNEWHSYGDTQIFPWAFGLTRADVAMPPVPCDMFGDANGGGLNQYDLEGSLCWQHRTMPTHKIRVSSDNPPTGLVLAEEFRAACLDIRGRWKAKVWDYADQSPDEAALAAQLAGDWFGAGMPECVGRVSLLPDGRIVGGKSVRWRVSIDSAGEQRIVIVENQRAVAFLVRAGAEWASATASLVPSAPAWWDGCQTIEDARHWAIAGERLPERMDGESVVVVGPGEGAAVWQCVQRGAARVVAIEPDRLAFGRLVRNMAGRTEVTCVHALLCDDGSDGWLPVSGGWLAAIDWPTVELITGGPVDRRFG